MQLISLFPFLCLGCLPSLVQSFAPLSSVRLPPPKIDLTARRFVLLHSTNGDHVSQESSTTATINDEIDSVSWWRLTFDGISSWDINTAFGNIQKGSWGSRGELFFVAQAFVVLSITIGTIPIMGSSLRTLLGTSFLLGGAATHITSVVQLGSDAWSPFPKPPPLASLQQEGIYSQLRHPMYTGVVAISLGLAILTNSADRLILTGLLAFLLDVKSNKEEAFLVGRFGNDYSSYKEKVPSKFVPARLYSHLASSKNRSRMPPCTTHEET